MTPSFAIAVSALKTLKFISELHWLLNFSVSLCSCSHFPLLILCLISLLLAMLLLASFKNCKCREYVISKSWIASKYVCRCTPRLEHAVTSCDQIHLYYYRRTSRSTTTSCQRTVLNLCKSQSPSNHLTAGKLSFSAARSLGSCLSVAVSRLAEPVVLLPVSFSLVITCR